MNQENNQSFRQTNIIQYFTSQNDTNTQQLLKPARSQQNILQRWSTVQDKDKQLIKSMNKKITNQTLNISNTQSYYKDNYSIQMNANSQGDILEEKEEHLEYRNDFETQYTSLNEKPNHRYMEKKFKSPSPNKKTKNEEREDEDDDEDDFYFIQYITNKFKNIQKSSQILERCSEQIKGEEEEEIDQLLPQDDDLFNEQIHKKRKIIKKATNTNLYSTNNNINQNNYRNSSQYQQNQRNKSYDSFKMESFNLDSYRLIKYKTEWEELIEIRPSEQQLSVIVNDITKDTKIIACAGSGKTTTLIIRLKYLLDHEVKPNQIIVCAFNVEAGKHIRSKVNEIIGKKNAKPIKIGNIDKLALGFIKRELDAKQKQSTSVLKFSQREHCVIWLNHIRQNKQLYEKFKYFFFDEFQDVSEWQYEVLMEFKKLGCLLTVIGDDAQNIYAFRDTKIDIIQNRIDDDLKAMQLDLSVFNLSINYRSTHEITEFANQIIQNSDYLMKKTMESYKDKSHMKIEEKEEKVQPEILVENEYPYLHIFYSYKAQNEFILQRILSDVRNKQYQFKDIAILAPMNDQLKQFEESIEKYNETCIHIDQIPYQAYITCKTENFKLIDKTDTRQRKNKLTLSTIHKSKGPEWDVVYILGCNDDICPMTFVYQNADKAIDVLEEQRRLFYVGVTRAGKELYFCCLTQQSHLLTLEDQQKGKYKVTRFIAEIPREYYRVSPILDEQSWMMKSYKWIDSDSFREIGVLQIKEVIAEMSCHQLQDINMLTQNVREEKDIQILYLEKFEISQIVKYDELFNEMGVFFDRLIIRMIGEKYNAQNTFYDDVILIYFFFTFFLRMTKDITKYQYQNILLQKIQTALQVILPHIYELQLPQYLLRLYLKIQQFIVSNNLGIEENEGIIIERFAKERRQKTKDEVDDLKKLHSILLENSRIQCVRPIEFLNFQKSQNCYFKDQYERLGYTYITALNDYMDKTKKSDSIYNNIYLISKCKFLFEKRRKYLYNNNLEQIFDKKLLQSIKIRFIQEYLSQFKYLEGKRIYQTDHISGLVDLIADNNQLFFFRFDLYDSYKKEDLLNYLFAAAVLRVQEKFNIHSIRIYNFLTGTIKSLNLIGWNQQKLFINNMEQIAKAQILKINLERKMAQSERDNRKNDYQEEEKFRKNRYFENNNSLPQCISYRSENKIKLQVSNQNFYHQRQQKASNMNISTNQSTYNYPRVNNYQNRYLSNQQCQFPFQQNQSNYANNQASMFSFKVGQQREVQQYSHSNSDDIDEDIIFDDSFHTKTLPHSSQPTYNSNIFKNDNENYNNNQQRKINSNYLGVYSEDKTITNMSFQCESQGIKKEEQSQIFTQYKVEEEYYFE